MSTLVGFVTASQDATKLASSLFTIHNGTSPFQHGVEFTVSGYDFKVSESVDFASKKKEKTYGTRPNPVLVTSIGDLFVRSLQDRFNKAGELMETDGDLNKQLKQLRVKAITDGEILQALVDFCKDKTMVVRRSKPFNAVGFNGREIMVSLVNIDVKE